MSIVKFLCGECEFMGYWFDKPGNPGPFWWRKYLREYDEEQVILNKNQSETIRELYDQIELRNNENKELKIQVSNYAYQADRAKRDRDNAESELLKANNSIVLLDRENISFHGQLSELKSKYDVLEEMHNAIENAFLNTEEELLKAKERFCQCAHEIKTGSTSAMHCNHCGKIEQSETWLKDAL